MRTITISIDVFARIWALREAGEDSEDAILRRVLAVEPRSTDEAERRSDMHHVQPTSGDVPPPPRPLRFGGAPERTRWVDDIRTARESALDLYSSLRDGYRQLRESLIRNGEAPRETSDDLYELDEDLPE